MRSDARTAKPTNLRLAHVSALGPAFLIGWISTVSCIFGDLLNVLYLNIPTMRLDIILPVRLRHQ